MLVIYISQTSRQNYWCPITITVYIVFVSTQQNPYYTSYHVCGACKSGVLVFSSEIHFPLAFDVVYAQLSFGVGAIRVLI
jgi:hypothetical protein